MLILKLIIVPLFILLVTFAGYRWGTKVSGILGGMPVVAGPIVVLLAFEQGQQFAMLSATTAIISVVPLLIFGISYCWACLKFNWFISFIIAVINWLIVANILLLFSIKAEFALLITFIALSIAPYILPAISSLAQPVKKGHDLIWRMLAGGLLTLLITQTALFLGERWSGMLAVFPIIGSVLAIFTHVTQGREYVTLLYRGMIRGLYSLTVFFYVLAIGWGQSGMILPIIIAVLCAILIQVVIQIFSSMQFLKFQFRAK